MHRANSHECLFAFIDFTVKIKRLINCKVIYNRYKHHWTKIREIFWKWQKGIKHKPTMSYCYLFQNNFIPWQFSKDLDHLFCSDEYAKACSD